MTRKKQQLLEVQKRFSKDKVNIAAKVYAFMDGAEWEHKRLVNKACEWLLDNAHLYVYATTKEKRALMFDNFKKAMEE